MQRGCASLVASAVFCIALSALCGESTANSGSKVLSIVCFD